MTDRTDTIYTKIEIEVSWSIELGLISDRNQIGQWRDWSYRSIQPRNQNSTVGTDSSLIGVPLI